jgi:hypothetical protein
MRGKIFITRSGYDPARGKHIKDPYLGDMPTMGACRPDIRRRLEIGDHIFTISGKVPGLNQFVMGGFEIAQKISTAEAHRRFPTQKLRRRKDGQLTGNVVADSRGRQYRIDDHRHDTFGNRLDNYVVGCNPIILATEAEVELCRQQTLDALHEILKRNGSSAKEVVTRFGADLTERQILELREWLQRLKESA